MIYDCVLIVSVREEMLVIYDFVVIFSVREEMLRDL